MSLKFMSKVASTFLVLSLVGLNCCAQSTCMDKYRQYDKKLTEALSSGDNKNEKVQLLIEEITNSEGTNNCIELDHLIVKAYLYSDRGNEALAKAKNTLNKDKDNPFSNMFLGLVYEELGESSNAIMYMEKSYDLMPDNQFIKINYCSTLSNHGYTEKATALCPK